MGELDAVDFGSREETHVEVGCLGRQPREQPTPTLLCGRHFEWKEGANDGGYQCLS